MASFTRGVEISGLEDPSKHYRGLNIMMFIV